MRLKVKWVNGWAQVDGYTPDGRRLRRALKTQDPRKAEELRAQIEARLWETSLYGADKTTTFEEAALAYAEDGGEARFLVQIAEQIGHFKLNQITPQIIRNAAKSAFPKATPATWNRQGIVPARAVMNYAHAQGWCQPIKVNAFPVKKPKKQATDRDYIEALRPHIPLRLYALMLYLRQTGRRVGDAISLTPEDRRGTIIHVHQTKTDRPIVVKITEELASILDQVEPRHGLLFGYVHRSSVYSTLRRACTKAGIPYLGTHQPGRHSFASELKSRGLSSSVIAEAGGWASTRMVDDIYVHPKNASAQAADLFAEEDKKWSSSPEPDQKSVKKQAGKR